MEQDFLITAIHRIVLVGKYEYESMNLTFSSDLQSNEIVFHFSGYSTVEFNGKILKIVPNTVRFLPKGENRGYTVTKQERGECILVCFDTDRPIAQEAFAQYLSENNAVGKLFQRIFSVWVSKGEGYYFECLSLLYKIFSELQKQNYLPEAQNRILQPVVQYIGEHFLDGKISAETLTRCSSVSYSYLKKLFQKKFGVPPNRYINQLKINYACDLLRTNLYSVSQVAEHCGYSDLSFFSRQFKEYVGIAPNEFAAKYKSSK